MNTLYVDSQNKATGLALQLKDASLLIYIHTQHTHTQTHEHALKNQFRGIHGSGKIRTAKQSRIIYQYRMKILFKLGSNKQWMDG